jgi:radical SAM protein with 4Fe4S-binding SPASM domain
VYYLEKVALKEKGPLFIVPWRCTLACENNCVHCESAGKQVVPGELDTAAAKKIVDEISDFGATFFGVTGGQPFLRKDLFEVISYAQKQGLSTSIITDGRLMDERAFAETVKNKVRISISIDGAEKTNDTIRGAGAYEAAVSAIEKLSREKLLDCLVYTFANKGKVTNANEEDMRHVIDLARKYGSRWVVFHGFIPYSKDKASLKADLTPRQYEQVCNKLYDLTVEYAGTPEINVYIPFYARVAKQRGMKDFDEWYNNFFLGRCWFGKFFSVAENGEAIPCSYNDVYRIGNVKDKSLKQIWNDMQNSEFYSKARDKSNIKGKCGVCEYRELCGGCRTAALFYTGDILGSDLRCAYIPKALIHKK